MPQLINRPCSNIEIEQNIKVSEPLLNKHTEGNEPPQYFKVKGDGNVNEVLDPSNCYYSIEIQDDKPKKPFEILVQYVTIKRAPDKDVNKHKIIGQIFIDEEGENDKDAKYDAC